MAIYAVGDIQGCYSELSRLLSKVRFDPSQDQLWAVGDLVNRGPESLRTLRFIRELGDSARIVLGNHDLHLLAVAAGVRQRSRGDTIDEILEAADRDDLLDWLRHQPLLYHDRALDMLMVHAGIPHIWSIEQALSYSAEVEQALRDSHYVDFFRNMYGNDPDCWDPGLSGWPRLRLITNYLTRMRICDSSARLNLKYSAGADTVPHGFRPWFNHPRRAQPRTEIIFGHWAALGGKCDAKGVHALDTGCVWGHQLSLLRLGDRQRFSIDCQARSV